MDDNEGGDRNLRPGHTTSANAGKVKRYGRSRGPRNRMGTVAALVVIIAVVFLAALAGWWYLSRSDGAAGGDDAGAAAATGETAAAPRSPGEVQAGRIRELVASLSLEEKIGQMFMIGFEGQEPDEHVISAISDKHAGAVILFGRNVGSLEQVRALTASLQALASEAGHPAGLLIATDQEGGDIKRIASIGPNYPQLMIEEMGDIAATTAQNDAWSAAKDLQDIGVNTNLAPVVDVSSGWGTVMDARSYGEEPAIVADLGAAAVKGYNGATTISCPKHFPGLGYADGDSEEVLPTLNASRAELDERELVPFQAVIDDGAPMIMVAHLVAPSLDDDATPASMSSPMINGLLRDEMGFNGVVITDDLEMGAVTDSWTVGEAAVNAVAAGADMLIIAHTAGEQDNAYEALREAVQSGEISEERIDQSVARILGMKQHYRIG